MCIAIFKPAGLMIEKETLKTCFDNNPDGCGFAYINVDFQGVRRIKVKKSMDFETFYRQYERATRINPDSPFLIHFRIATHGEVSKFNCHPFETRDGQVFIHNGIINGVGLDNRKSDTQLFNDKILKVLPNGWEGSSGIRTLIEKFIVTSKLVVMNEDGAVTIFNEAKGEWANDIWWSNSSYKPRAVNTYYAGGARYGNYNQNAYNNRTTYQGNTKVYNSKTKKWEDYNASDSKEDHSFAPASKAVLLTIHSTHTCDSCRERHPIKELTSFRNAEGLLPTVVCDNCRDEGILTEFYDWQDSLEIETYLQLYNYRATTGHEC